MTESQPDITPHSISELVADPDFPTSAMGKTVDIKGFVGVVVDIVKNSIKVRSDAEGATMSYNYNALRRLYGPRAEFEPMVLETPPPAVVEEPKPRRDVILEPNFDAPVIPIEQIVHNSDFPKCAYGQNIDLHGFMGVVVELVGRSLKVRSREGSTRSYNADGLRKIHAQPVHSGQP